MNVEINRKPSNMLVQGPCGHPGRSFLLFLTPKSDSPDRNTGHMFPLTLNSEVMVEKTEVNTIALFTWALFKQGLLEGSIIILYYHIK